MKSLIRRLPDTNPFIMLFPCRCFFIPTIGCGRRILWLFIVALLFCLALSISEAAQDNRGIVVSSERLALVIGNSAYHTAPLRNPVNDAEDMSTVLSGLGFNVTIKKNVDRRSLEDAIRQFGRQLRQGGVGLFYFSGHGMQVEGRNYLIPVNSRIESESDVKYEAVDAALILDKMDDAKNQLNIMILDACRNNPFTRSFRAGEQGLARMDAPTGSLIVYSTAPGEVAADGFERNGVFTKHLIRHMQTPNMPVEQLLKRVRIDVAAETGQRQIPWESSSLMGDFYFKSSKTPKSIESPLSILAVSPSGTSLRIPDQPSIAVLPFVNLSEDPKQEFLSDGITENIINALSKVPQLIVIARNSSFTYKGKAVRVKQVSEELGVRYVLEGSVQRSGDRVRITAQLTDAVTGQSLFAERYIAESTDLFALQDDITMKVLGSVRVKLEGLGGSEWLKYFRGTQGLDCFLKLQEATSYLLRMTIADTKQAQEIAKEGLAMCPEIPAFYRILAFVHLNDYWLDSSKSPQESIDKATGLLKKALANDHNDAEAHGSLSQIYTIKRDHDKAIFEAERGVTLDPGSSWALYRYGLALTFAGRPEEAIPLFEKAIRLNPLGPSAFFHDFGTALQNSSRLDEAVAAYKKAIERAPNNYLTHALLSAVYSMQGHDQEAHAEAAEVLRINPSFSLEWLAKTSVIKDRSTLDKAIDAMRKAGLPDKYPPVHP